MRRERVRFPGSLGGELVGRLERPDGEPHAYALFAHCFTCGKDIKAAGWISRALVERGFGVLRFDFTGIGESEGDFAETDFHSNLDDLVAAGDFLRSRYRAPALLAGHSLGGAAMLAAASAFPEAAAVATIGAPADTVHLRATLAAKAQEELERDGVAEVDLGGARPVRVGKELFDDLEEDHLSAAIAGLDKALVVCHSPADAVVGIDHGERIFAAAKHPKSFVALDGAHHLLWDERDARWIGELLASWAGRYVEGADAAVGAAAGPSAAAGSEATAAPAAGPSAAAGSEAAAAPAGAPEGQVVVTGGPRGYAQEIVAGEHVLRADEPAEYGGTDTGPSPYGLLLAALGSCTSMTLRMYADRKQWPLAGVRVALDHAKIHAQDCADCETREGKIDRIDRRIRLEGGLDEEQRARLLEIADKCPVHRTLEGEIEIRSALE